ncbi:hypothetical protein [Candidatus Palauibacter soopunensis]|uniref:hypothetical protein n=1 Tax=Candidatus Palauibacter soopunensis TaxID=3056739 RepID=UPI0023A5107D|nr:hypothetical protein [Candidatus Palauibacter soopunensis]MDE2878682.1 hypothetical protein [Candidatus Palauibacter soopunensis]
MITRWNLSLSLTLALMIVAGGFSLLWERTNALHATQLELVTRVSRVEVQVQDLREDVVALREDMVAIREDVAALREEFREEIAALRAEFREEISALREELREEIAALREEIRGRGEPIRAHETLEVGAQ